MPELSGIGSIYTVALPASASATAFTLSAYFLAVLST